MIDNKKEKLEFIKKVYINQSSPNRPCKTLANHPEYRYTLKKIYTEHEHDIKSRNRTESSEILQKKIMKIGGNNTIYSNVMSDTVMPKIDGLKKVSSNVDSEKLRTEVVE